MSINGMDEWLKKIESLKVDFPKETEKFLSEMDLKLLGEILKEKS